MIPGPRIMAALDGFSPRHKPVFTDVLRDVPDGDFAAAARALGAKCAELNIQELPNPFGTDDARRTLWADGFRIGRYGDDEPPQGVLAPDFSEMTKPGILEWAANNLSDTVNQRLAKPDMIAAVSGLAAAAGFEVHPH